jgi:hypothetical protein
VVAVMLPRGTDRASARRRASEPAPRPLRGVAFR